MKAVEVHELRKEFVRKDGRKRVRVEALRGLTFDLARGECIAVLGQNGSGKSTLVRLLSTLLLPDGGSARIFGHDIAETRAVRRMVNRVSVEASFFKKMSAVENLAYAARFYGLTPRDTRERIPEILDRVGFPAARRSHAMENLSRGTQQKVALARALLDLAGPAPVGRADDRPRPAVEARGAGVHPRGPRGPRHDDPALHPRPGRGRGARRARRDPRRRAAALPRAGRRDQGAVRRRHARGGVLRRDRPVVRGGASRRRRWRCENDRSRSAPRADRPLRSRRAELVPRQAVRLVGARVLRLDDREHALDRLHLEGGEPLRRPRRTG